MNSRRGFLKQMLMAGAAFTILPPAETYGRVWRITKEPTGMIWRSNSIGIYEQLRQCGSIVGPTTLNLPEIFRQVRLLNKTRGPLPDFEVIIFPR